MKTLARIIVAIAVLAGIGFGLTQFPTLFGDSSEDTNEAATFVVSRRTLEDRVVERGTVESQKTIYGKCEIPGRNKITFIVPEGTEVKKGDRVAEFETTDLDQRIQEMEVGLNEAKGKLDEAIQSMQIKENENATNIAAAQLAFDIAEIDLKKYEEGDFESEQADLQRAIKEAEAGLEKIRDEKNNIELLVKKGYKTPQQLLEYQLREQNFEFQVQRDKRKFEVLVTYDREKKLIEFRGKLEEARLKLDRAKKTATAETAKAEAAVANAESGVKLREQQLKEHQGLREKAILKAEQDGTVVYANERWYDESDRIREGTEMYQGRNVYFLPDMSRMQVKVNVHESVVDRIAVEQVASIRLDAFAEERLNGTVSNVAGMAASSYGSVQNYETIVVIDEFPSQLAIKPGMTAEVDILVGTYKDVIAVPVSAITEHFEQSYVYVLSGKEAERRKVTVGRNTHSFVEVTEGLEEGEVVALDAYQRGIEDFAEAEEDAKGTSVDASAQASAA